jgi:cytoskeletal protein CcmA (bactofilin family)
VDGAAKVLGNVEVGTLEASGLLTVGGELLCQELRVRGSLDTFARVQVPGRFEVLGNARLGGPVAVGEAHLAGRAELTAELAATGAVHAEGHLAVAGDLSGSELRFSGTLVVAGAIHVPQIVGTLDGASRAHSVTCDSIELKRLSFPPWKRTGSFRADRIEAREVHLEGVHCEFLRADEIYLGPDCHVSRAEGRVVERHRSSYVGYESSSPRPPGLSR